MKHVLSKLMSVTVLCMGMLATSAFAQDDYEDGGVAMPLIDRYLDVQVWTNHRDGEFYSGDNIEISFMANRDAFVVIYSVDTRGRINMIFPEDPRDDNYVTGGVTYRLPDGNDDYDLKISGPEGTESIQIIASRERIPIPDWYPNSGLTADEENRNDYMDWLNTRYFVRYDGQRFAYDRAILYVNEWEPVYYHPVYAPVYPSWSVCGNVYVDYPYGGAVYINGIYWGCAPLYIPRILCGWHTVTIYDPWGYCWENDFHVSHYNTVVLNQTVIQTSPTTVSKYKEVRESKYKNPVTSGYPDFEARKQKAISQGFVDSKSGVVSKGGNASSAVVTKQGTVGVSGFDDSKLPKKYVRGESKLTKTDRGYETSGVTSSGVDARSKGNDGSNSTFVPKSTYQPKSGFSERSKSGSYQPSSGSKQPSSAPTQKGTARAKAVPKQSSSSDKNPPAKAEPSKPQHSNPPSKPSGASEKNPPAKQPPAVKPAPAPAPSKGSGGGGKSPSQSSGGKKKGN